MNDQLLRQLCCVRAVQNNRCLGRIIRNGDSICCASCGKAYPIVNGIGLLHDEPPLPIPERWFENMYAGRSRAKELESNYLQKERKFVAEFAIRQALLF
jgi:uncharacterized protein YbaR (Trm112 family)